MRQLTKAVAKELAESIARGWNVVASTKHGRMILRGYLAGQNILGMGSSWEEASIDFAAGFEARRIPVLQARAKLETPEGKSWKWKRRFRVVKEAVLEGVAKLKP